MLFFIKWFSFFTCISSLRVTEDIRTRCPSRILEGRHDQGHVALGMTQPRARPYNLRQCLIFIWKMSRRCSLVRGKGDITRVMLSWQADTKEQEKKQRKNRRDKRTFCCFFQKTVQKVTLSRLYNLIGRIFCCSLKKK